MTRKSRALDGLPEEARRALVRLGERVRQARIARGLTLTELSERMFVTEKTLRRLEAGEPGASLATMSSALFALDQVSDLDEILAHDAVLASVREARHRQRASRSSPKRDLDF